MSYFVENIKNICKEYEKVAMFIDMDGTINEYVVYNEKETKKKMEEDYMNVKPIPIILNRLSEIEKIQNVHIYILSLSKSNKISKQKEKWLEENVKFIPKKNWIILTKEKGEYNSENRDEIKTIKMKEKLNTYNHIIFLDDDHKILKKSIEKLGKQIDAFHISSAII